MKQSHAFSYLIEANLTYEKVEVRNDNSQVMLELNGERKVDGREDHFRWYSEAMRLSSSFVEPKFVRISREDNCEADRLSREAYARFLLHKIGTPRDLLDQR